MIFQNQISNIDSEINQLLAQVEAARQKQAALTELDVLTDSSLTQLKHVVSKVGHYDKSAIASLKSAILDLFDPGDHGPNQLIAPTPNALSLQQEGDANPVTPPSATPTEQAIEGDANVDDSQIPEILSTGDSEALLRSADRFWFGAVSNTGTVIKTLAADEYLCQIDGAVGEVQLERSRLHYIPSCLEGQACDIDKAPLTGQACEWASPLCSLVWEDTPPLGQHCIIIPSATEDNKYKGTKEGEDMPYMELVRHPENSAIAYQRKHDGEIVCVYVGFKTKAIAQSWLHFFEAVTSRVQLRQAKRLEEFKWEVKVQGISIKQIERYARDCDFSKNYRAFIGSAKPAQAAEIAVGSSIRVLSWQGHNCDQSSDIATILDIEDGMYQIDVKNSQGINIWLSRKAITPLTEALPTPAQQLGIEPPAGWRQVQPQLEQSIQENASILQIGDIVEVTGTRHPQHFGLVGTVEALSSFSELPISVRTPRGLKGYLRSDLKFISKGEKLQSQGVQPGQVLMGDRIITSGKYIGEGRVSRLLNAQLGTADKIAAIELGKNLKNLGFDPRLAATVMAGEDDASDF